MSTERRQRGYTLVELGVVITIIVLGVSLAINRTMAWNDAARRDTALARQAHAMAELTRAARDWAIESGSAWTNGQRAITVAQLVTAGRLRAGWQEGGLTPLGQSYIASVVKSGPQDAREYRVMVAEQGTPAQSKLARLGIAAGSTEEIQAFKEALAKLIRERHHLHAGTTNPPAGLASIALGGQISIADQIVSPPLAAVSVVVLEGYPELSTEPETVCEGRCNAGPVTAEACQLVSPAAGVNGTTPSCPSGYTEAARWTHCAMLYSDFTDNIRVTPAGPVGFSSQYVATPATPHFGGRCDEYRDRQCRPAPPNPILVEIMPGSGIYSETPCPDSNPVIYLDTHPAIGRAPPSYMMQFDAFGTGVPFGPYQPGQAPAPPYIQAGGYTCESPDGRILASGTIAADTAEYQVLTLNSGTLATYQCTHGVWSTQTGIARWGLTNPHRNGAATGPQDVLCCR